MTSIAQIARFDGFQRCLPFTLMTYFDVMDIMLASAYGHTSGDLMRIPMLIPEMYALAKCGHFLVNSLPKKSSIHMLARMAIPVLRGSSKTPDVV